MEPKPLDLRQLPGQNKPQVGIGIQSWKHRIPRPINGGIRVDLNHLAGPGEPAKPFQLIWFSIAKRFEEQLVAIPEHFCIRTSIPHKTAPPCQRTGLGQWKILKPDLRRSEVSGRRTENRKRPSAQRQKGARKSWLRSKGCATQNDMIHHQRASNPLTRARQNPQESRWCRHRSPEARA